MSELRKEFYIPIEIKAREFYSQLLLGGRIALKGGRVFIGSKYAVDYFIENKKHKHGTYLYKGGGASISKFKSKIKKLSSIAVLDQEVSPAIIEYSSFIRHRFVKGSLKYVSRLYYVGEVARKSAKDVLTEINPDLIKAFGWPRIDLWKPKYHKVWHKEVQGIKSRFPQPFLLFTSDFGCTTQKQVDEFILAFEKRGTKKSEQDLVALSERLNNNFQSFKEFIAFLETISAETQLPNIIVRPHPSEDHQAWNRAISHLPNVHCVYEGSVSPWLLASEGLIHRGCTSAIEAFFSRKKAAVLLDFIEPENTSISVTLSTPINDSKSILNWYQSDHIDPLLASASLNVIEQHVSNIEKESLDSISHDLFMINGKEVAFLESDFNRQPSIAVALYKKVKNKILSLFNRDKYLPTYGKTSKMQDGINLAESDHILRAIYPDYPFYLRQPAKNIIIIEPNESAI